MQDLKVSVAEILGRPAATRHVRLREPLGEVQVDLARLNEEPVDAELTLESVVEGVLVTGSVAGDLTCRCARCLTEFDSTVRIEVCELFAAPGHLLDEDTYRVEGDEIDLEPMLRDEVALSLPLNPLCRNDCKGMCAGCGRDLNEGACDCVEDALDPRWAGLDAVRMKLQQR